MLDSSKSHPDSYGGKRLLPVGLLHTGHAVTCCERQSLLRSGGADAAVSRRAVVMGAVDGSLSFVAPVADEASFRRLAAAQEWLSHRLPQPCGLNPRSFRRRWARIARGLGGGAAVAKPVNEHGLLDGDLLWRLLLGCVPGEQLAALGSATGMNPQQVAADLADLSHATAFFL